MKILIFYQYFGTPKGGWSTRYYEFTRRWVAEGTQVTVVTSPYYKSDIKGDGFISRQQIEGVELIVIDSPDSNKDSFIVRAWNAIRFSIVSAYFALTEPHDIVISSSGPITTAIPGLLSKWLRRKKFVFEVRDLWPKGGIELEKLNNPIAKKIALSFEKLIYKNSDLIVACSQGMEKGILDVNRTAKTIVIPNSSDVDLFSGKFEIPVFPVGFNQNKPIFIYAGSLGLMDECSQIIRGLSKVDPNTFSMVFIGDGAERQYLEKKVLECGLGDSIFFLGLIPKTEVVKWFGIAVASFVTFKDLPVLHTNSPNKMFDSFAAGIPVIQSTKGWIANLINETNCGINVDPGNPEELTDAVRLLIENPSIALEMGHNAKLLAETRFNRGLLASEFLEKMKVINS